MPFTVGKGTPHAFLFLVGFEDLEVRVWSGFSLVREENIANLRFPISILLVTGVYLIVAPIEIA